MIGVTIFQGLLAPLAGLTLLTGGQQLRVEPLHQGARLISGVQVQGDNGRGVVILQPTITHEQLQPALKVDSLQGSTNDLMRVQPALCRNENFSLQ